MFENIEWLFFDVGSTLIDERAAYEHRLHEIADSAGLFAWEIILFDNRVEPNQNLKFLECSYIIIAERNKNGIQRTDNHKRKLHHVGAKI